MTLTDREIHEARQAMAHAGLWPEFSSAAGVAGIRKAAARNDWIEGAVVAVQTSCGLKDPLEPGEIVPHIQPHWDTMMDTLRKYYGLALS